MGARLITIPISHFCEKARWALDRAGVDYAEKRHLQLIHVAAAKLAGGGRTVPVLITGGGDVLADSTEILRWADSRTDGELRLYPEGETGRQAAEIEAELDRRFGPDGRLWMYHGTLPVIDRMGEWALAGVPRWERGVFRIAGPLIDRVIRRYLSIDAQEAAAARRRVDEVFADVAARLSDGRPFLLGDRFTAADLTFAALAAPLLLPERYGSPLPPVEAMPPEMAAEVRVLREHPAGRFADRLYATERTVVVPDRPRTIVGAVSATSPKTLIEPGHAEDWARLAAEKRSLLTPPPDAPIADLLLRGQRLSAQAAALLRAVERADERARP